ncbi:ABC transporter ATP-binding protein [Gordonia jinhuaensis]|uniref:Trehalose import ATP-binding protein SugC n=1 Tax=Gordonia jinhuaensis TaxID=1517702 RepID=A0A916TDF7_9ACTN|nr:ABC transporter ATP-binding protein [Gordonia jinhuaensis]GGB39176.1 sugar ABC transporter ATP-binding protein [Gordonia jinhuaensis]
MSRIDIVNVSAQFTGHLAVDNVSLTIDDGDFVVLLGPSGCGKTTLLRMIAGLLEPTDGRILIDGNDMTTTSSAQRNLAMVFQSYALYPHLTVAKNIEFPLATIRMPKQERRTRVEEVAATLGLQGLLDRRPKELSGGQRQRVAVGRALARRPGAYLMDEPLSNLDAKLRTATRTELSDLHQRLASTFIYVTHDQVEAMTMATKIAILNSGRIEQVGTPTQVYDRPASVFVAGFIGSPPMNLVDAQIESLDSRVTVSGDGITGWLFPGDTEPLDVTIGVRPEHLLPAPAGHTAFTDSGVRFEGRITRVENLGSHQLLHVHTGSATVTAAVDRMIPADRGDAIALTASADNIHLFDTATGRRLEWIDDPESAGSTDTPRTADADAATRDDSRHGMPSAVTGAPA